MKSMRAGTVCAWAAAVMQPIISISSAKSFLFMRLSYSFNPSVPSLTEHRVLLISTRQQICQQVEHLILVQRLEQILGHQRDGRQNLLVNLRFLQRDGFGGVFGINQQRDC